LTVYFGGDVKPNDVQEYCHKGGHTRKGVYLPKGAGQRQDQAGAMNLKSAYHTDPYCPAVRPMSSDDTPLVLKTDEKFPAKREDWVI
jgi:hypothetical protein